MRGQAVTRSTHGPLGARAAGPGVHEEPQEPAADDDGDGEQGQGRAAPPAPLPCMLWHLKPMAALASLQAMPWHTWCSEGCVPPDGAHVQAMKQMMGAMGPGGKPGGMPAGFPGMPPGGMPPGFPGFPGAAAGSSTVDIPPSTPGSERTGVP